MNKSPLAAGCIGGQLGVARTLRRQPSQPDQRASRVLTEGEIRISHGMRECHAASSTYGRADDGAVHNSVVALRPSLAEQQPATMKHARTNVLNITESLQVCN